MNSVVYLSLISSAAAFFSGAIAFLYKPSIDERDGRKRLTPVGRFAFAFFVISSVSAFASAILGSWEAESSKVATRISAEEETRWRARSERLEAAILNNTRVALKESEEVTKRMFSEFSHQQQSLSHANQSIETTRDRLFTPLGDVGFDVTFQIICKKDSVDVYCQRAGWRRHWEADFGKHQIVGLSGDLNVCIIPKGKHVSYSVPTLLDRCAISSSLSSSDPVGQDLGDYLEKGSPEEWKGDNGVGKVLVTGSSSGSASNNRLVSTLDLPGSIALIYSSDSKFDLISLIQLELTTQSGQTLLIASSSNCRRVHFLDRPDGKPASYLGYKCDVLSAH